MIPQREPGAEERAVRADDTATGPLADGGEALGTASEYALQMRAAVASGPPDDPRRRRRILVVGLLVLVLGGAGAGGYVLLAGRSDGSAATSSAKAVATAAVSRTNMVDTEQQDGSLGYDDQQTLRAWERGVLTGLPDEGAIVAMGQALYQVNNKPVTLWYGTLPLYRTLADGIDDGPDVTQLERNLDALGYGDGLTVDDHFSSTTADAVKAWQADRGLEETGTVDATQVVFVSRAVRVGEHKASVADRVSPGRRWPPSRRPAG
jgi:Putative peptidoglycan binding domain